MTLVPQDESKPRLTLKAIVSMIWATRDKSVPPVPATGWRSIFETPVWTNRVFKKPTEGYRMWAHANPREYAQVDEEMTKYRDRWLRANGVWVVGSRPITTNEQNMLYAQWLKTKAIQNATSADFREHHVSSQEELAVKLVEQVDQLLQYDLTDTPAAKIAAYALADSVEDENLIN